ncbi:MAG: dienelactone hydrolase family protein [Candidatus Omnitrophica bacterium]|nr:dienelactone hydrolase family protein [Candidatus Omnitrophota bacterium]
MKYLFFFIFAFISCVTAYAGIHTETIEYKQGDTILEGYLAYDDSLKGKVPAVLIVHEWTGPGPYVKNRAQQLAGLGYVAFAVDVYGKGVRPKDKKEAGIQAGIYRANRPLMRQRVNAGLQELKKYKFVDSTRIAAIGYCFGGGAALELARSGAGIAGVVSFHGNLDTPYPEDAKNIKAKILVCHGADDPAVPEQQLAAFEKEMRAAKVDWQTNIYGNAVHSFTNPGSGNNPSSGAAYNEQADKRSWEAMKSFFNEIFAERAN